MYKKCRSINRITGKMKLTNEPRRIAKPNEKTIPPRYIGFRLCWKTPSVTKILGFSKKSSVVLFFLKVLLACMHALVDVRSYVAVTKPRIVFLLGFTSVAAMVVAWRSSSVLLPFELWVLAILTTVAGCAGCNVVTCYIDRDIDSIMVRTQKRPLPSRKINPAERALYFGLFLVVASLILAGLRNLLSFVFVALGIFDNVVVYSLFLKRRNPLNIVFGGISGGIPVAFGWTYVTGSISLTAVAMAALVVLWIPNHIWSLALRFRQDYEKANVPMLPVVFEEKNVLRCIGYTSILLVAFSILLFYLNTFDLIYLATASVLGSAMLLLNFWLLFHPTRQKAWLVFKFSSPYLAIIFLAMIVDVMLS